MKISFNWLKNYIETGLSAQEVADLLTSSGLEVESVEKFQPVKGGLEGLIIGKILTKEKHPDADRLNLTTVDVGQGDPLHIVCGASNVDTGQKVVVATVGTTLYPSSCEPFQIKKSKIRGAVSEGMICAEDEIGLGNSHEGIMVLASDAKEGTLVSDYFKIENDFVFEIGLTPNRADATSHIGVARDLAAILSISENRDIFVKLPDVIDFKIDNQDFKISVEIEDKMACPRYSGITITGIKVEQSPKWLQQKLKAIGLKPINNIVDITNFVLHETGQPLHAFDATQIKGNKIIVKKVAAGTKFKTLDDVERQINAQDLMICDSQGPLAIAGVFGGKDSGVSELTTNVFLESAYFNAVSIRKTARVHGLKTDASFRYERGTDPNITVFALKRAALLIKQIAGGQISSEVVDVYPEKIENFKIQLSYKTTDSLIGKTIDREIIKRIIRVLGIEIHAEFSDGLSLSVPPFKVDVTREVDLIEEVLRIYGYNNIEIPQQVRASLTFSQKPDKDKAKNIVSDLLSNKGFNEIMSNSLTKINYVGLLSDLDEKENVNILNPLSSDLGVMRRTLIFGGLEALAYNINRKNANLKFYEFGKTYKRKQDHSGYDEKQMLALFLTGSKNPESWNIKEEPVDFYYLKGFIQSVFERLGLEYLSGESENTAFSYGLRLFSKKETICEYGELNKKVLKALDINQPVFYAEVNWDLIVSLLEKIKTNFTGIPKFPFVRRDLALLIDKNVKFQDIEKISFQSGRQLLKEVNLFDVYEGEKLEPGKKSYAVSFILQDPEKTLTDVQIDKFMDKLQKDFQENLGATLR
ncbi:MAG: phenylalanine--tRNA ligase subunit beta [Bacteroidetes bacterium]|nr:phenylalanine--tRNA ligase subunit beta [Bacteroidota bacterium]HET6243987.1 phenylalanine--tRNA ligase subunit beta [Bacteroidia bacterium]